MKYLRLPLSLSLVILLAAVCHAQFFTQSGAYSYALNSANQVMDISPDGKIAVTLKNDPGAGHPAYLTAFDPLTGTQFDSKSFGFGPLGVWMAKVGDSLRAVVLTSQGGPRTIFLFDVSAAGRLTQLGSTQLTSTNFDYYSNVVLSGQAGAGFTLNPDGSVVSFSLTDASIIQSFPADGGGLLVMSEADGKRVLAFVGGGVRFVDATNPAQMSLLGAAPLSIGGNPSLSGMAFSPDGRYLFVGNSSTLSAIDVTTRQVVGTLSDGVVYQRVRVHENNQRRLLAVTANSANNNQSSVLLIDATDVTRMSVKAQYAIPVDYKSDLQFTPGGGRVYVANASRLVALEVPSLTAAWEKLVPGSPTREQQVLTYGQAGEVLSAWMVNAALGFNTVIGSFPADLPGVSVSDAAAAEGGAADFTITLSAPSTHRVTVNYQTSAGTATATDDYAGGSGSVVFQPGETTKTVSVQTVNDTTDEFDETFKLNLTNVDVGLFARAQGAATLFDDDPPPAVTINDLGVTEGDTGVKTATLEVLLSQASAKPVTVSYSTTDGTATAGSDYVAATGDVVFNPGETRKLASVTVNGDTALEPDETVLVNLGAPVNATLGRAQATLVIFNDDPKVQFESSSVTVTEGTDLSVTLNVTRSGDLATTTTVSYATFPGTASDKSDYTAAYGTLRFAPGETTKGLTVLITDDAYAETQETFSVGLSGVTGGGIGPRGFAAVRINSNDAADGPSPVRQSSFDAQFFVRQHYLDFLGRAPDSPGTTFWAGQTTGCGSADLLVCRVNVSAAFFLSIEFQETGYLAYKTYGAAYGTHRVGGTVPLTLGEFLPDTQALGSGVVVNQGDWRGLLEANKQSYFAAFVSRPSFVERYPASMAAAQYVDALNANADGALGAAERDELVTSLEAGRLTRAQVLRAVAENAAFSTREKNRAFVLMQYFGYLRRNPFDAPERGLNFDGYNFWLGKLNEFNGDFVRAEMVKAFLSSDEYSKRFGQ